MLEMRHYGLLVLCAYLIFAEQVNGLGPGIV